MFSSKEEALNVLNNNRIYYARRIHQRQMGMAVNAAEEAQNLKMINAAEEYLNRLAAPSVAQQPQQSPMPARPAAIPQQLQMQVPGLNPQALLALSQMMAQQRGAPEEAMEEPEPSIYQKILKYFEPEEE